MGETDTFTADYKIRASMMRCHGGGKVLTIEMGNGNSTGGTKCLNRGSKDIWEKSTVRATLKKKSVANVLYKHS